MKRMLEILTPENVFLEYELAGLGSRFAALFIDQAIQIIMLLLVGVGMLIGGVDLQNITKAGKNYNSVVIALGIVLVFIIWFGYFIFFEMIMNGQSPGKKIMGLRVINQNGEPIGLFDSLIRNILRTADMLPSLYLVGAVFILFTREYKRIGDFAANSIVIKVRKSEMLHMPHILAEMESQEAGEEQKINIYPVSNFEYSVVKEFLERKDKLGARRPTFIFYLNKYFMKKFSLEKPPYHNPYEFFEEIIKLNSGI